MIAIYDGKEYECSSMNGGKRIKLLSDEAEEGFVKSIERYTKIVDRSQCSRVYKRELCFEYCNDSFLVKGQNGDMVLLEAGPRSYDLKSIGFKRVLNDTFQKWVKLSEGRIYWNETDY